jgi:hypothetical protein
VSAAARPAAGACACGAVTFTAAVTGEDILACHCLTCRRLNAGPLLTVTVRDLVFRGEVAVFRASAKAERPFCPRCGTTLAFIAADGDTADVGAFLFDPPLGLTLRREVHADEKPAGYAFAGVPDTITGDPVAPPEDE